MSIDGEPGKDLPASAFEIRETLDEAVRTLSVNASSIQKRVQASGTVILDRLSPSDFPPNEDRELFEQIQAAFADMRTSGANRPDGFAVQMSDARAEGIAADILDLRDTTMGRAIRNARVVTRAHAHVRPRR
jgi:uncharacterized protein (DUF58 family)